MAGVIGLRGPDIDRRDALRGFKVEWRDADRPIIRPHTGCPVLTLDASSGEPRVDRHVFGFSKRFTSFNARDDKLLTGRMWSRYFAKPGGHGVVPVSYILEWANLGSGKQPYRIQRADGGAMAVPALVGEYWESKEDRAFALVTVQPNKFVERIHPRVIAQLRDDAIDTWLHPETNDETALRGVLDSGAEDELVALPLSADVGSARFDDMTKLEPIGPAITWAAVKETQRPGQQTLEF